MGGAEAVLSGHVRPGSGRQVRHDRRSHRQRRVVGDAARRRIGNKRRSKRVRSALETLDALMFYDVVYVGGGNARHVTVDLGPKARTIDNRAGMLGGIKLWERRIT